jgi:hypothetical protein
MGWLYERPFRDRGAFFDVVRTGIGDLSNFHSATLSANFLQSRYKRAFQPMGLSAVLGLNAGWGEPEGVDAPVRQCLAAVTGCRSRYYPRLTPYDAASTAVRRARAQTLSDEDLLREAYRRRHGQTRPDRPKSPMAPNPRKATTANTTRCHGSIRSRNARIQTSSGAIVARNSHAALRDRGHPLRALIRTFSE